VFLEIVYEFIGQFVIASRHQSVINIGSYQDFLVTHNLCVAQARIAFTYFKVQKLKNLCETINSSNSVGLALDHIGFS
jgi:hypothetical protein